MPDPTKLGKYEIVAKIGRGGMGHVYRATDPLLKREVAIKTMLRDLSGDEELRTRFMREAQSAGGLRHPNIVTIYDLGEDDEKCPYIAMEFLTGTDLEHVIKNRTPLSILKKLDIIIQTCQGLGYAHSKGIVHRDIKPANIRLLDNGEVKIMDFGIAKIEASHFTRTGMIMGTPHYMSPEQIRGEKVDGRSDIFSIGVVLYELLVYRKPYPGDNPTTVLFKIIHSEPDPLADKNFAPPEGLEEILLRALAKKQTDRYSVCEEMMADLMRLFDHIKNTTSSETIALEPKPYEAITVGRTPVPNKRVTGIKTGFNVTPPPATAKAPSAAPSTLSNRAGTPPPAATANRVVPSSVEADQSAPTRKTPIPTVRPEVFSKAAAQPQQPMQRPITAAKQTAPGAEQPPQAAPVAPQMHHDLPPISPTPVPSMTRKWALLATSGAMGVVVVVLAIFALTGKLGLGSRGPAVESKPSAKVAQPQQKAPAVTEPATATRSPQITQPETEKPPSISQPATFVPMPGWLSLNIQPWAEVKQIKNETGESVPLTSTITPCKLQLPPGKYLVTLYNSQFQGGGNIEVVVRSNETTVISKKMEGFDYAKAVDSLGL